MQWDCSLIVFYMRVYYWFHVLTIWYSRALPVQANLFLLRTSFLFFFFYTKFINSFFNTMKTFFIWHYGNPFKRLDILNGIGKKRWNAITFCWFQLIICQDWKSITKDLFWITFTTYHGICSILMTISLLME